VIIVDTSVLISYLRDSQSASADHLQRLMDEGIAFAITPQIFQEVLQGAYSEREFTMLQDYLETQIFLIPADSKASYAAAAHIYYLCRKKGITVSGAANCLIAQTAIEHDAYLLHDDADYDRIASIVPLKIFR
jgi:predicted nucleic acid-binding protein